MIDEEAVFLPVSGYDEAKEPTVFAKFDPSTTVLPAGFETTPQFCPLPVDIVFERDTAVTLRDGTTIRVDVFRPTGTDKVPVIVAWSPYGKSGGTHPRNWNMFKCSGNRPEQDLGSEQVRGSGPCVLVRQRLRRLQPRRSRSL